MLAESGLVLAILVVVLDCLLAALNLVLWMDEAPTLLAFILTHRRYGLPLLLLQVFGACGAILYVAGR